jgi:sulfatase-like protein
VLKEALWFRAIGLVSALALLNASLSFESAWPTPGVVWRGALSLELAALLLALVLAGPRLINSRPWLRWVTAAWLTLVAGHYATVSATSLYGRDVNLFWDLRFIPDVVALLARPERAWVVGLALIAAVLILVLAYAVLRWALGRVWDAMGRTWERRAVGAVTAASIVAAIGAYLEVPYSPTFSPPVTQTYVRQARLMAASLSRSAPLPPSPPMNSDLSQVEGMDVFLFFVEAYGAVSFDRPDFSARLAGARARLETAIHDTNRQIVSAYVESPTFGGSSWLAHISLLSGVQIQSHDANALLMSQKRSTLVTLFKERGYRTVALMPGTWQQWPEGKFYGFDVIYGGEQLEYRGPPFGWWDMTDQFALARLDQVEVARAGRAPLFVLFPMISTHIPFTPTPPYQPDWSRMLTPTPYDEKELEQAYERQPDWLDLGPSYVDAVSYVYRSVAGWVQQPRTRDFVMILIGDHQPAAAVSGEHAPWDVPVHVVTDRSEVLERLKQHGFRPGLTPIRPTLGPMHLLTPVLLEAFGNAVATAEGLEGERH